MLCFYQFPFLLYVKTIFLNQTFIKLQQGGKKRICTRNHIFFVFGMSRTMTDLTTVAMETCVSGADWQLTQFEGCLTSKIEVCLHVESAAQRIIPDMRNWASIHEICSTSNKKIPHFGLTCDKQAASWNGKKLSLFSII